MFWDCYTGNECLALNGLSSPDDTVFRLVSGVAVNSYFFTFFFFSFFSFLGVHSSPPDSVGVDSFASVAGGGGGVDFWGKYPLLPLVHMYAAVYSLSVRGLGTHTGNRSWDPHWKQVLGPTLETGLGTHTGNRSWDPHWKQVLGPTLETGLGTHTGNRSWDPHWKQVLGPTLETGLGTHTGNRSWVGHGPAP